MLLAFLLQEKRLLMAEPKTIYCPLCGRKVSVWDGKRTINIVEKCYKCKKLIIFDVEKRKTKIRSIPQRETSSGMRLY